MTFGWLKRYAPRSLYLRATLILLLPVVALQIVLSVAFVQRLFEGVTAQLTTAVTLEIAQILTLIESAPSPTAARDAILPLADALQLNATLPDPDPVRGMARRFYDLSGRLVIQTLTDDLPAVQGIDLSTDDGRVDMTIATSAGPLGLDLDRDRVSVENPHQLPVIMLSTALLMTLVSYLFLKNQLRPIARLAEAATAFGRGRSVPYSPSGATEVRIAGAAFLDMRGRIERQIEQRTTMLSGISHDLRTPLTRLKLGLEMIDDPESAPLRADVEEMRRMLDAFLEFSRDGALDDPVKTDPAAILQDVAEKARRAGTLVELGPVQPGAASLIRPLALSRALENLVGNAARHGTQVRMSLAATPRALVFSIEDDGPGIPEDRRGEAMRAFTQLDSARNQNFGAGVGLGLAIALDVARQHGGALRLDKSDALGGLRADLILAR